MSCLLVLRCNATRVRSKLVCTFTKNIVQYQEMIYSTQIVFELVTRFFIHLNDDWLCEFAPKLPVKKNSLGLSQFYTWMKSIERVKKHDKGLV